MANPAWPASLPQNPFGNDDPAYKPADIILRTQTQGGLAKARPLFTRVPTMLTITLILTQAQRATLLAFIETTLGYVNPFDWLDFRTGAAASYRYGGTAMPTEKYVGGDYATNQGYWQLQFDLELLP